MLVVDTHVHAISTDTEKYPLRPLGGAQSDWSRSRPVDGDRLIQALDGAGIDQAILVQASTAYGFDNSYAADVLSKFPDRLAGVCSVDFLSETAVADLRYWITERGFSGVRIRVSDGATKVPGPGVVVSDERMHPVWDYAEELGIPVCIQMHSKDAPTLLKVLERNPLLTVILDHAGRPNAAGGPPYTGLAELESLAQFDGVYLKLTPPALRRLHDEPGIDVGMVLRRLVATFGADRFLCGSDYPATGADLAALHRTMNGHLEWLADDAKAAVSGGNAARLYGLGKA